MSPTGPMGRLVFHLHQKRITSEEVIDFLKPLLRHHPTHHVVLEMTHAKPQTSKKTIVVIEGRKRLKECYLGLNPPDRDSDEKVWNHLKNYELKAPWATKKQETYEQTEEKLENMSADRDLLQGPYFRRCLTELLR